MCRAAGQTGYRARPWIDEHTRTGDHSRILRRRERHFNHINTKQRRIRILVRSFTRAPSQLFVLTDEGSAGYIDVNVVLIIRIDDQRVRVRSATSLHCGDLLRTLDVTDIEDSRAAKTIFLRRRWLLPGLLSRRWRRIRRESLYAAIDATVGHLDRHEHQVLVNRHVALTAGANHRSQQTGLRR